MQHLGRVWHGPKNSTFKGEGYTRRITKWQRRRRPRRKPPRRKSGNRSCEAPASLNFCKNMASALAVRGGLSFCAPSARWITDGPPAADPVESIAAVTCHNQDSTEIGTESRRGRE